MKCDNCGFENDEESVSCIVCGTSLIPTEEKKVINKNIHQDTPKKEDNSNDFQKTSNIKEDTLNNIHSSVYTNQNIPESNKQDNPHEENNKKDNFQNKNNISHQNQSKNIMDNQKSHFHSTTGDIKGDFDRIKTDDNDGKSSMYYFTGDVDKTFDEGNKEKIKKSYPSKKDKIFSTRNIAIICTIFILLTLAGCIYVLHQNDVKNYYNESSRYDPEYHYSYDPSEYNQTSYSFNEIYTAHTPQDAKMQMFKESDVNGDGVLKGNEISKMDYKLKNSKYAYNHH